MLANKPVQKKPVAKKLTPPRTSNSKPKTAQAKPKATPLPRKSGAYEIRRPGGNWARVTYDARKRTVTFCNGGHIVLVKHLPAPVVFRTDSLSLTLSQRQARK